jgi:hypothetical protein
MRRTKAIAHGELPRQRLFPKTAQTNLGVTKIRARIGFLSFQERSGEVMK